MGESRYRTTQKERQVSALAPRVTLEFHMSCLRGLFLDSGRTRQNRGEPANYTEKDPVGLDGSDNHCVTASLFYV